MSPPVEQVEQVEDSGAWPPLPYAEWADTLATLHRWTQIVGKTRLALEPMVNHWWQVPLYVSARGLTTSAVPYGKGVVDIELDFLAHQLVLRTSEGGWRTLPLAPRSVAEFYADYRGALAALGVAAEIWPVPVEIPDTLPFPQDRVHAAYDAAAVRRFWRVLISIERVFRIFRGRFLGKVSPVHLFWGGFDVAVTRFSGRPAPPHPGGGAPNVAAWVMREAYSHEVSSAGFWPGGPQAPEAAFYSYAYPLPEGYAEAPVRPAGAFYHRELGEFIYPYATMRAAPDPEAALLDFLQSTYEAAANTAHWDRAALERPAAGPAG
jgi:hypothetical protein